MRRRLPILFCCLALALAACGGNGNDPSPAELAKAKKQLVDGGLDAYQQKIESLSGKPIVVNQWASWCGPCRQEFPWFSEEAKRLQGKVEFLGVNTNDSDDAAAKFLAQEPVPYDSFKDRDEKIAHEFRTERYFPSTVFYDRRGKLVDVHRGVFKSREDLADAIREHSG